MVSYYLSFFILLYCIFFIGPRSKPKAGPNLGPFPLLSAQQHFSTHLHAKIAPCPFSLPSSNLTYIFIPLAKRPMYVPSQSDHTSTPFHHACPFQSTCMLATQPTCQPLTSLSTPHTSPFTLPLAWLFMHATRLQLPTTTNSNLPYSHPHQSIFHPRRLRAKYPAADGTLQAYSRHASSCSHLQPLHQRLLCTHQPATHRRTRFPMLTYRLCPYSPQPTCIPISSQPPSLSEPYYTCT